MLILLVILYLFDFIVFLFLFQNKLLATDSPASPCKGESIFGIDFTKPLTSSISNST